MSRYWSEFVHTLHPYVPGEQPKVANLVKLNTNENPFPPSPSVLEAMQGELDERLRLYPDPGSEELCQAIADYHGVQRNQVFVGNGSDEVLAHLFNGLFRHDKPILFPDISYSFYPVYCGLYSIESVAVPLDEQLQIRVEDYAQENGGIIFPNPNAPTGRLLELGDIERLLERNRDSVVVIDEAYIDFGGRSAIELVDRFENLLVVQTLSKSRSLAGLRVGFAVGHPDLIEALVRIKDSFNSYPLDRLAQRAAIASFADEGYFQECREQVISNRVMLTEGLEARGFEVLPSAANFVFASHSERAAEQLAAQLREHRVIVRHFNKPRINDYLRITVGTLEQQQALFAALDAIADS